MPADYISWLRSKIGPRKTLLSYATGSFGMPKGMCSFNIVAILIGGVCLVGLLRLVKHLVSVSLEKCERKQAYRSVYSALSGSTPHRSGILLSQRRRGTTVHRGDRVRGDWRRIHPDGCESSYSEFFSLDHLPGRALRGMPR